MTPKSTNEAELLKIVNSIVERLAKKVDSLNYQNENFNQKCRQQAKDEILALFAQEKPDAGGLLSQRELIRKRISRVVAILPGMDDQDWHDSAVAMLMGVFRQEKTKWQQEVLGVKPEKAYLGHPKDLTPNARNGWNNAIDQWEANINQLIKEQG